MRRVFVLAVVLVNVAAALPWKEIVERAALEVRSLVPPVRSQGWQQDMMVKVEQLTEQLKQDYGLPKPRQRRSYAQEEYSITRDPTGVFILRGTEKNYTTGAKFPSDVNIFSLKSPEGINDWYAVSLESKTSTSEYADQLIIYKYNLSDSTFKVEMSRLVLGAVDVEIFEIDGSHYLAVAEHAAGSKPLEGSTVFKIIYNNGKLHLEAVQTINTKYPRDITVWKNMNMVFLAVAQSSDPEDPNSSGDSLVYQWLGQHFDLIWTLPTSDARSIQNFSVNNSMFLVVANHKPLPGHSEAYSEIFKYNLHTNTFTSHQKLKSYGAMDAKVFCFQNSKSVENFMIIANMYYSEEVEKNYHTESVIYKLVGEYFVPFQSLSIPAVTHWEPVVGNSGEFVLLGASELHGVRAVQYNGWRFIELDTRLVDESLEHHVSAIRALAFMDKTVVVVASKNNDGHKDDIIELTFSHDNELQRFHKNLEGWCEASIKELEGLDMASTVSKLEYAPKKGGPLIKIDGNISFANVTIAEAFTQKLQTLEGVVNKNKIIKLNEEYTQVSNLNTKLETLTNTSQTAMQIVNEEILIAGNLELDSVSFASHENSSFGGFVQIRKLNGQKFENLLTHTVDVRTGLTYSGALEFEHISVDNGTTEVKIINGVKVTDLIDRTSDAKFEHPVLIFGDLHLKHGAMVKGYIDGSRSFPLFDNGTLHVSKLKLKNLDVLLLNEVPVQRAEMRATSTIDDKNYQKISTKRLIVDGLISGVDIGRIDQNYLQLKGDQVLTGELSFDNLIVEDHCDIEGHMSGVAVPQDLVLIDEGKMQVNELHFSSPLSASHITVKHKLNDLQVGPQEQLPLLLTSSKTPQFVTSHKSIDDLQITGYCDIQGSINGVYPRKEHNSNFIISENIFIDGDVNLQGKLSIDGEIYANDISGHSSSVNRLFFHGIHLDDTKVTVPLSLMQKSEIMSLKVNNINNISPSSWVQQPDSNMPINIPAEKTITGDLHFSHPFNVKGLINGIEIHELDTDVLRTTGDQIITGHKIIVSVSTQSVNADEAWLGNVKWSNILHTSKDQHVSGTKTLLHSAHVAQNLESNDMHVDGMVAGVKIQHILDDSILIADRNNQTRIKIHGRKVFENGLSGDNVTVLHDEHFKGSVSRSSEDHKVLLYKGDVQLTNPVHIDKLILQGTIDSVPDEGFGHAWVTVDGDHILKGNQTIKHVYTSSTVNTTSGLLNGVSFRKLASHAFYIDQPISIQSSNFEHGLHIMENLQLDGELQDVNIHDLVINDEATTITGYKTFNKPVTIKHLKIEHGQLGGLDLPNMCKLAFDETIDALRIQGSSLVEHEPHFTDSINEFDVDGLRQNIWFEDQNTSLTGYIEFKGVNFKDKVLVKGSVDNINLHWLEENYLSKTKDQHVKAKIRIDDVTFKKNLYANTASIGGEVGDVKIESFTKRILKDGPDQLIMDYMVFEKIHTIGDVQLQGKLSGLDLSHDVMLLSSGSNEVTGRMVVQGLNSKEVVLADGVKIQGVDVPYWFKQAVKTSGNFAVKGRKSMDRAEFSNIQVSGLVNNKPFSSQNIMIQGIDQEVTGEKTFAVEKGLQGPAISMKYLNIDGFINNMDFDSFCSRIAYIDGRSVFTAYKNITASLSVDNANIHGLYQGVNISELSPKGLAPESLKELEATLHYLIETARITEYSLKSQAVYLSHYHVIQTFPGPVEAIIPVFKNDSQELVLITPESMTEVNVAMLAWSDLNHAFEPKQDYNPKSVPMPYYINSNTRNEYAMTCSLPECNSNYVLDQLPDLHSDHKLLAVHMNGKQCILTFTPKDQTSNSTVKLFCQGDKEQMDLYQEINASNPIQAASLDVGQIPYLIIAQGPATGQHESHVSLWQMADKFVVHQVLDFVNVVAVAATEHRGQHLIAVASGLLQEAAHQGTTYILRLEADSGLFKPWLELSTIAPIALKFATLPSKELVLYVLSENQAAPLSVFIYRGEEGFREKTKATTVASPKSLNAFNFGNKHFVALAGNYEGQVLEAKFKGVA